jgi:hypothetical protein
MGGWLVQVPVKRFGTEVQVYEAPSKVLELYYSLSWRMGQWQV